MTSDNCQGHSISVYSRCIHDVSFSNCPQICVKGHVKFNMFVAYV